MIRLDKYDLPVSVDDSMDSCVRKSILSFKVGDDGWIIGYVNNGYGVRHPFDSMSSNKWNFTKDQLKMLICALKALGYHYVVVQIMLKHIFRLGFTQSFQRDIDGTWKFPWPHGVQDFETLKDGRLMFKGKPEVRLFDMADWLLPNDWLCFVFAGKLHVFIVLLSILYWKVALIYPVGYAFHFAAMLVNAYNNRAEQNQMIAECRVLGTFGIYKKITKNWKERLYRYWIDRDEVEYAEIWEK